MRRSRRHRAAGVIAALLAAALVAQPGIASASRAQATAATTARDEAPSGTACAWFRTNGAPVKGVLFTGNLAAATESARLLFPPTIEGELSYQAYKRLVQASRAFPVTITLPFGDELADVVSRFGLDLEQFRGIKVAIEYNRDTTVTVKFPKAVYLGHVGATFEDPSTGRVVATGVENHSGAPLIAPGGRNDWFYTEHADQAGADADMRRRGYDHHTCYSVGGGQAASPHFGVASTIARAGRGIGYSLLYDNCEDFTWAVLYSYGVPRLPNPSIHPAPADWYRHLPKGTVSG